jgi:NAD(P) transhydrogenase subunit alpha
MKIGIPKESLDGEARVATTPEIARKLIGAGLEVLVERGAGAASFYTDAAYEEAGVELTDAAGALACDIVAKVR